MMDKQRIIILKKAIVKINNCLQKNRCSLL